MEDAEKATRIRKDYLQKLENDDHVTMPEPIYVRAFVRTYADYPGLNGDRLAAQVSLWQERSPLWDH